MSGVIGAAGFFNRSQELATVNVEELVKSYKIRKASLNITPSPTEEMKTAPRRQSYTGIALYCDTAIDVEEARRRSNILTLSERVERGE